MVHIRGTDDIMNRKSKRNLFLPVSLAALGLCVLLLGFSGCGDNEKSLAPEPSKTEVATKPTPESTKKTTSKSRFLAPNADLSARERRALKAKGELSQ
jgi:hypothetical protein